MKILAKLFGSEAKTKIIRLFLFNPEASYTAEDVFSRTTAQVQTVLTALVKLELIKKKSVKREIKNNQKGKSKAKKAKDTVFFLNKKFPYIAILSDLMAEASIKADNILLAKLVPAGKLKLIIASGIFTRQNDARLDLLIAGDDINDTKLARIIKSMETDIGRDLAYSSLTTADFLYRLGLHDRLIRDVIDFPHIVLLDRIGFKARK